MRAGLMYGAGDVRVETVPDPNLEQPTDALVRVGAPKNEDAPVGFGSLFGRNITLAGRPARVRAYIQELLPEVLDGQLEPGLVFARTVGLEDVPAGYRAMDDRESLKVLVQP